MHRHLHADDLATREMAIVNVTKSAPVTRPLSVEVENTYRDNPWRARLHDVDIEDLMDLDALKHLQVSEELLVLFRRLRFKKVGHILDSQKYIKHYLGYFRCSQEANEKFKELIDGLRLEAKLR